MATKKHAVNEFGNSPSDGCVNALLITALTWFVIFVFVCFWIFNG